MRTNPFLHRPFAMTLAVLALGAASGCLSFFDDDRQPVVAESQLNWLEITYLPGMGQPPVQLSLLGTGNIRIRRGSSPQIGNDFSQDVANIKWNDVSVDQLNVQPAEIRHVFQSLVNRGLLREPDKAFAASANRGIPMARITGTLGFEHVARLAAEPEIVGFIRDLLKLFDNNITAAENKK